MPYHIKTTAHFFFHCESSLTFTFTVFFFFFLVNVLLLLHATQETRSINKQHKIIIIYTVLRKATQLIIEPIDKCSIEGVH
jgi:hypothetical protein